MKKIECIESDAEYYCDINGNIYGPRGRLKPRMGGYKKQYCRFGARLNGKQKDFYIHRIILQTFKGPPPTQIHQAAHINGNPLDNRIENLVWATPLENSLHKISHGTSGRGEDNSMAKISNKEAIYIIKSYGLRSSAELSYEFNISTTMVTSIATGRARFDKANNGYYFFNRYVAQKRIADARSKNPKR